MTLHKYFSRLLPWSGAVLVSVAFAFGAIEATRIYLVRDYKTTLASEANRRAVEIASVTLSGNVMGSIANLGLVSQAMKSVARGEVDLRDPVVMDTLQAVGKLYQASGVFVVNRDGIVRSSWDSGGKSSTGLDIKFRPYFQIAMKGKNNVYAAISLATGQRALYFAAPLYDGVSSNAPVIGAAVVRLNLERIDSILQSWKGHALLLSPQEVVFAATSDDWVALLAREASPTELKAIRALKQFGKAFENDAPKILPFDIGEEIVRFNQHRYTLAHAPVQWNDPHGDWNLVLMGELDGLLPIKLQLQIGASSASVAFLLCSLYLISRRRLQLSDEERMRAEVQLKEYAEKLERDSWIKSHLVEISGDLQKTVSLTDFARKLMIHLTERINAEYGAIYLFDENNRMLTPMGGYGVLADELENFAIGQGLVGQCGQDKAAIVISNSADSDISIIWGGGEVAPQSIILLPVVAQAGQLLGVVVLASLRPIDPGKRALLDALMPIVAMNLDIQERNQRTKSLLETSREQSDKLQKQTDVLSKQQEELRESSLKRDEANRALQSQVEELAGARNAMMNIMEDLEISRKETEERNAQTQSLLEDSKQQMDELERFNRLTINREEKMIELKEEINTLLEQTGKEKKYKIVE